MTFENYIYELYFEYYLGRINNLLLKTFKIIHFIIFFNRLYLTLSLTNSF